MIGAMKESLVVTEQNLDAVAEKVLATLASTHTGQAKVLFLDGDLGAGKTTFTKALANTLGIVRDEVHSPTFILKKEYESNHPVFTKLIHIDAYRFESKDEVNVLKLHNDHKNEEALIVIEWPQKIFGTLSEDMVITFSVLDDETREMTITYALTNPFRS